MENNKIEEIKSDLDKAKEVAIFGESKHGGVIVESLTQDVIASIEKLCSDVETLSHAQFIAVACDIKTKLSTVRAITRAKKNEEYLQGLLKEALQE